jgi:hypothetical protein
VSTIHRQKLFKAIKYPETSRLTLEWISTKVTRFTRVWIETLGGRLDLKNHTVTRFTRVWIETLVVASGRHGRMGHPLHAGVD